MPIENKDVDKVKLEITRRRNKNQNRFNITT